MGVVIIIILAIVPKKFLEYLLFGPFEEVVA